VAKWAVITGAAGGIGAVIARAAVKHGYHVAAWDANGEAVAALAADIGDACVATALDVVDEAAVLAAMPFWRRCWERMW